MPQFCLRSAFRSVLTLLMLISGSVVSAQTETVEAEIVSVNAAAGSVELTYQAALGKTQSMLDVSKKAKITINGEPGTLEGLRTGQKATVIYNTELAIVTSIQATGDSQAVELVRLEELNGSFPTLSGDGLELISLQIAPGKKTRTLHVVTRKSLTAPFGKPVEIRELSSIEYPRGPFLSADSLTLCFRTSKGNSELVSCRRTNRSSSWSAPRPLLASSVEQKSGGQLTWPWLSADGLKLLAVLETGGQSSGKPNLYRLKRPSVDQPFSEPVLIENAAIPLMVRSPRFLPQTGELFVSGVPKTVNAFGIGVVKGFSLPE